MSEWKESKLSEVTIIIMGQSPQGETCNVNGEGSPLLNGPTGSTFPNISGLDLNDLEIDLPPLPEQRAIASILSSLDNKIDLLHRQNKTLEALAERRCSGSGLWRRRRRGGRRESWGMF